MALRITVGKRVRDEEVVGLVVKVILREGTVATQKALAELVNDELDRGAGRSGPSSAPGRARGHDGGVHVTAQRVRVLAARSGLVGLQIRARLDGPVGELKECPVCHSKLKRTENRTLTGRSAATGYKCTRCPWWTGRELRVPHHYTFSARVQRAREHDGQLSFVHTRRR